MPATAFTALMADLERRFGDRVARDAPLGDRTTWRVGGPAAVTVRVDSTDDLQRLGAVLPTEVPRLVLGRGSNLLVADAGFPGVVVDLGPGFETVAIGDDDEVVHAGGATALPVLARQCAATGHAGLGFYVGIPGTVGGAVRMNAGGHGRSTAEVLRRVEVVDLDGGGTRAALGVEDLDLGYRSSSLGDGQVVTWAEFEVTAGDPDALRAEVRDIVRWRTEHQPGGANAGSVFTNPPGDHAGRLIDEVCGLGGLRVGNAVVSTKHANFMQAEAGATAADVHQLIARVRDRVGRETGIWLEPEVHMVGFESPLDDQPDAGPQTDIGGAS